MRKPLLLPAVLLGALAALSVPVAPRPAPERDPGRIDPPSDPLPPGALARLGTTRLRSARGHGHVAISPDAKTIVTTGDGLQVWDGRSGELRRTIPTLKYKEEPRYPNERDEYLRTVSEGVAAMAFAADSGVFHALTDNGLLRSCDLTTGTWSEPLARAELSLPRDSERYFLHTHGQASLDGTHFIYSRYSLSGGGFSRAELLTPGKSVPLPALAGEKNDERQLWYTFASDNKLISINRNGPFATVNLDVAAGGPTATFAGPGEAFRPLTLALAPDGRTVAICFAPQSRGPDSVDPWRDVWPLHVYDTATGAERYHVADWKGAVIGFTRDGTRLLALDREAMVVADAATGEVIHRLSGHAMGYLGGFSLSANGTHLAAAADPERSLIVWNLLTGKPALDFDAPRGRVQTIVFSPDGETVFTSTEGHTGWLWDARTGQRRHKFVANGYGRPQTAAFTPDSRHLVAGYGRDVMDSGTDFAALLWNTTDGKLVREFRGHTEGVKAVTVSPDGKHLATLSGSEDDGVFLWELNTGKRVREVKLMPHHESAALAFPKDGELIGLVTSRLTQHREAANLWTGKFLGAWKVPHRAEVCALSPDGKLVVTCESWDRTRGLFTLRDARTGVEVRRLPAPDFDKSSPVAFSANGKIVAVGEKRYPRETGLVRLFDTATGRELRAIRGHTGAITALCFSPDGTRLATGSTDTTVLIWDLTAKP